MEHTHTHTFHFWLQLKSAVKKTFSSLCLHCMRIQWCIKCFKRRTYCQLQFPFQRVSFSPLFFPLCSQKIFTFTSYKLLLFHESSLSCLPTITHTIVTGIKRFGFFSRMCEIFYTFSRSLYQNFIDTFV